MIDQFPHCDARVLHAPGECEYCDRYPDWQELRKTWMVAFTGHEPQTFAHAGTQVPCPADFNRPPDAGNDHRRWAGNVATSQEPVNETVTGQAFYGGLSVPMGTLSEVAGQERAQQAVERLRPPRHRAALTDPVEKPLVWRLRRRRRRRLR